MSLVTVGAFIGVRSLGTLFTDGFQRGTEKIHIMSCKLACNAVYGFSPERKVKFCVFGRILYRFFSVYAAGVKIVKLYCYGCEGIVG